MSDGAAADTAGTGRGRGERKNVSEDRPCGVGRFAVGRLVCCWRVRRRRARCVSGVGVEPFTYPRVSCGQCTRCGDAHRRADGVAVDMFRRSPGRNGAGAIRWVRQRGRQEVPSAGRNRLLPAGVRAVAVRIGEYLSGNRTVSVIPLLSCPVLFCPVLSAAVRGGRREGNVKNPLRTSERVFLVPDVRPPCGRR